MDKISNINQILSIIRSHTSSATENARLKKASAQTRKTPSKSISRDELKRNIILKLQALPPSTDFAARSKDVFLESVLLWEFGNQLANDPLFADLKMKVRSTFENNVQASAKLEKLIQQLFDDQA